MSEKITNGSINGTINYTYDKVSNRTSRTSSVAGVTNQTHSYTLNDLLSHHTYDDNGSTIASPDLVNGSGQTADVYDFRNKLIRRTRADGIIIDFSYNADGHRVKKEPNTGKSYHYLVDNNNPTGYSQVVEERNENGIIQRLYHIGHTRLAMEDHAQLGGQRVRHYYSLDGHGSVRALTDATGEVTEEYEYDSYGILIGFRKDLGNGLTSLDPSQLASHSRNEFLFAGEQWDADMGMYYNRARYYDVENGRFNAMDSWEGRRGEPITLNKYLYGNGNPVSYVDPSGNFSLGELGATMKIMANLVVRVSTRIVKRVLRKRKTMQVSWGFANAKKTGGIGVKAHHFILATFLKGKGGYRYDIFKEGDPKFFSQQEGVLSIRRIHRAPRGAKKINLVKLSTGQFALWHIWVRIDSLSPDNTTPVIYSVPGLGNSFNCFKWTRQAALRAFIIKLLPI